jgi:hypothetical protein
MNRLKYIILGLVLGSTIVFGRTIVDTILKLGNGTDVDVTIEAELGKGVANPALNYDSTNDKWQFCNEGDACADMGSGGGGGGGVPLLGKGSLLTSDGATNGEFTACADDELIVWDSAEVGGFKCEAKPTLPVCADNEILVYDSLVVPLGYRCEPEPSGGGGGAPLHITTYDSSGTLYRVGNNQSPSIASLPMPFLTTTFTAVSNKPIIITALGTFETKGVTTTAGNQIGCNVQIFRIAPQSQLLPIDDPQFEIRDSSLTTISVQELSSPLASVVDVNPVSAGDVMTYSFTLRSVRGECTWLSSTPTVLFQQGL